MIDYGYGDIGNRLVNACTDFPPDFQLIKELLNSGIDLHMVSEANKDDPYDKYETMLSEIIKDHADFCGDDNCQGCPKDSCYGCSHRIPDGRYLPEIVRLFLEKGFDCSAQNNRIGAVCLQNLTWSTYDEYILDAAKFLLKAGAKPDCIIEDFPEDETVLDWVAVKESAADCVDEDHALSNLFYTLYEIMDACIKGEEYDGIQYFDHCVGKRIERVMMSSEESDIQGFFRMDTEKNSYEHCFRDQLIIWCEDMPLCINRYTDAIIDPRVPVKMKVQENVSEYFTDCIGSRIVSFTFEHISFTKFNTIYHQPITLIHLDNGKTIRISTNSGEVKRAETAAYFTVV